MLRDTMSGVPNPDRDFLHSVPPEKLIGPAAVVDVSEDPPHLLPVESLLNREETQGSIEADEAVIFNFGWHRKWRTGSKEERSWNIGPDPQVYQAPRHGVSAASAAGSAGVRSRPLPAR
jgi:kynurenine formamidase